MTSATLEAALTTSGCAPTGCAPSRAAASVTATGSGTTIANTLQKLRRWQEFQRFDDGGA
jgi:hypothetical protein